MTWDVYHIENFLLEPSFIRKVLKDNLHFGSDMTEDAILTSLKECARHTLPKLVAHRLRVHIDKHLKDCLDLGFDPSISDPATGFSEAVLRVRDRVSRKTDSDLGHDELNRLKLTIEATLQAALTDNRWLSVFKGRDILQRFAGKHMLGLPYEAFRDAILARMGDANFQPPGMARVIEEILSDELGRNQKSATGRARERDILVA